MEMKLIHIILISIVYCGVVLSAPQSTTESLVVSLPKGANEETTLKSTDGQKEAKVPKIYSMNVDSNVTNRFATTLITSKVKNLDEKSQEATFAVILPETAYISGFVMEIDGKKYEAYVKEKEEAKKTYDEAVSSGVAAGLVSVSARDSNRFTVSVNIEPQSKATFYLTYEELLKRQKGLYDIVINLHPGQLVKDLEVKVNINETRPLTTVKVPSLRTGNEISKNEEKLNSNAEIQRIGNNTAQITFKPDIERQKELGRNLGAEEKDGLSGQFVVQYDVERDPQGGEILVSDGYFVHFFAPSDLKPLPKYVVFVLDTSGSMYGARITQLKEAMKSILGQLNKEDSFGIVEFNSVVKVWNIPKVDVQYQEGFEYNWRHPEAPETNRTGQTLPESFVVSEENVKKAKEVVEKLEATGGTNIYSALEIGLKLMKQNKEKDGRQPIVMFLTDGEPTSGEVVVPEDIVSKISKANTDQVPIFSLSFGDGADRAFLEKISLKNEGFARHIYEGADAALQLESFYKYISSPLLNKVNFKYVSQNVSKVTKTVFPILFDGSEIVVAGRYLTSDQAIKVDPVDPLPKTLIDPGFAPVISCYAGPIPKEFVPKFENPIGSLEKHWAYLTLQQILDKRDIADNKTELTKQALDLALKYSFVTPVTSLVVVKPNATKAEANVEDASKANNPVYGQNFALSAPKRKFGLIRPMGPVAPAYAFRPSASAAGGYGYVISTPFYFLPEAATTELPIISSTALSVLDDLKKNLPWIENIIDKSNGKLNLSQGQFILDSNSTILDVPECPQTPLNGTGTCVLLKECPQIYELLKDESTYNKYFCPLHEFAGVCCPVKPEELPKIKNRVTEATKV